MADDMFLKIEPLEGESQDAVHRREIDVLAWSWSMSQSATSHVSGGAGAGRLSVQDLSVTKYVDNASTELMRFCSTGRSIKEARLTVRRGGRETFEYLVIVMKQVIVSSVSTGGSAGDDRLTENVTLNFGSYKIRYTPQNDDGTPGERTVWKWDIAAGRKP